MWRLPLPDWILCSDWLPQTASKTQEEKRRTFSIFVNKEHNTKVYVGGGTHHLLPGQEKIAHGGRKVKHRVSPTYGHLLAQRTEEPEVVVHGDEREGVEGARILDLLVLRKHGDEVGPLRVLDIDSRRNSRGGAGVRVEEVEKVEKRVCRVRVVPAKWL
jgi:hypothetical protein